MKTIALTDLQTRLQTRKAELGMTETPAEVAAMRNPGSGRTPAKRELLRRIEARAAASQTAGENPLTEVGEWESAGDAAAYARL